MKRVKRDFDAWLDTFRDSIASYSFYTDFERAYSNLESIKIELNILNSLIGSKKIEHDFSCLISKYPDVLKCVPILLAKREMEIYCHDKNGPFLYEFNKIPKSIEQLNYFMRETGLFDLLENHIINNVVDYVLGVEVGLGTHGRKNRGGHLMEDLVEEYIIDAGFVKNETYYKEMWSSELNRVLGIDISQALNDGQAQKRFDFVIKSPKCIYACECNFYSSAGSKLNETARSYKNLALETKDVKGFEFVWFTDGIGWKSAKNNLQEVFDTTDRLYNIKDLEDGILSRF